MKSISGKYKNGDEILPLLKQSGELEVRDFAEKSNLEMIYQKWTGSCWSREIMNLGITQEIYWF